MVSNLKRLRAANGMTQEQLAQAAGVPRICIARYETGKHDPGIRNVGKIAAALGCSLDDLIGREDDDAVPDNRTGG